MFNAFVGWLSSVVATTADLRMKRQLSSGHAAAVAISPHNATDLVLNSNMYEPFYSHRPYCSLTGSLD